MATFNITIPPQLGEISLVSTWIGTLLYGVNCMVYAMSMYLLLSKKGMVSSRWVLLLTSTLLIVLSTIYIAASLRQLLEAFIYVPGGVPNYPTVYFANTTLPMRTLKDAVYVTLVFVQDIVLIWRLYIVFCRDWKVTIFFILLDLACIGTAYADAALLTTAGTRISELIPLTISSWSLDLVVNVSVTFAIAARLWWMGRKVASYSMTHSSGNPYSFSMHVIVESGAIFAGTTIVQLALYVHENGAYPYVLPSLDIACQLATLTPLLIVIRVGLYQSSTSVDSIGESGKGTNTSVASRRKTFHHVNLDVEQEAEIPLRGVTSRSHPHSTSSSEYNKFQG